MKKCPTCERKFEDTMRFCQSDGTPLVDDAPPIDPYKTMVAKPDEIASAIPPVSPGVQEPPAKEEEDVLQLPVESDPLKTMYASEEEIRKEMEAKDTADQVMDIPPLAPEPPKFSEPSLSPPTFGDVSPPPSPFAPVGGSASDAPVESPFSKTTPPIPSPFTDPKPSTYEPPAPNFPQFKDPEPVVSTASAGPFDPPASAEWTPPPVIEPSMQNQGFGQNNPSQPAGTSGQSQTLAIISLVVGILSIFCCGWFVPGIAAVIMGFIARSKASNDPANYGGSGLALGGIITGVFSVILGIIVVVLYFLGFLAGIIGNAGGF